MSRRALRSGSRASGSPLRGGGGLGGCAGRGGGANGGGRAGRGGGPRGRAQRCWSSRRGLRLRRSNSCNSHASAPLAIGFGCRNGDGRDGRHVEAAQRGIVVNAVQDLECISNAHHKEIAHLCAACWGVARGQMNAGEGLGQSIAARGGVSGIVARGKINSLIAWA